MRDDAKQKRISDLDLRRFRPLATNTTAEEAPLNLHRLRHHHAEVLSELPHSTGVLCEVPSDKDRVCGATLEDLLRELAVRDAADGGNEDLSLHGLADVRGEIRLVRLGCAVLRGERDLLRGVHTAGRDVDEVDAVLSSEEREAGGVFDLPRLFVGEAGLKEVASGNPTRMISNKALVNAAERRTS